MKINLLKNFVTNIDTLSRGLILANKYTSTIGLKLDFIHYETSKQFTSIPFSNEVNPNGYVVNPIEIFQEAKKLGATFDIDTVALLVYDWSRIKPQPTNPMENGQNIQISCQWYASYPEVFVEFFLHELSHFFHSRAGVEDLTHLLTSGNLQSRYPELYNQFKQGNGIDYYLFLLKRFMKPKVTLKRISDDGIETLGELSFENFNCKTLERPFKGNITNISAIPKGIYDVQWRLFPRKWRFAYKLQNVPNRTGIFIHAGNYVSDVQGCILLGDSYNDINFDGKTDIINSRITIKKFEDLLGKRDFQLEII